VAIAAFLVGFLLLLAGPPGTALHGLGALAVGGLCLLLMTSRILPEPFARSESEKEGPAFEVGDPKASTPAPGTPPLIQAMHRIRGKRPPRE
jgi:hypothetical protein